jgi:orotate phosphoribosyltransferase
VEAKAVLDKIGVIVDRAVVIVDRNDGARENLEAVGCKLQAIFNIKELV